MVIKRMMRGAEIALEFTLEPAVSQWAIASESEDELHTTYKGDGYTLALQEERQNDFSLVEFALTRDSGESFSLHQYVLKTESSIVDLDRIWMPWYHNAWVDAVGLISSTKVASRVACIGQTDAYKTAANKNIPIFIGMNRSGVTRLAVGFLDQRIETDIEYQALTHFASAFQPKGTMRCQLRRPLNGYTLGSMTEHNDGFFISSGASWFDTMQTFRAVHDEKTGRTFRPSPDEAWEPLWAPWGGTKGNWEWGREEALDAEALWENALVASELGIRGTINWGGWFRDVLPRFNTEKFIWAWPDDIGDFVPSAKIPDMRAFVRRLKSIGVMCNVWISPWMAGRNTKIREKLKEALIELDTDPSDPWYNANTSYLCPRNPITQKYVPELMAQVLRDYELDGYTVDMIDNATLEPCIADHEHNYESVGLATADTFAAMREAMDAVNPNAVIEFRAPYSNIANLYNATAHRSVDSGEGGSYDMNRRNCVLLRSYIPPGIAVHFDPQWWHKDEKNETVAKMLSTMVVSGVPQIGVDLVNLNEDHRQLVKDWLSFYQEHKEDFRWGEMRPVQHDPHFSTIKVERGRKAFVSYASYPALKVPLSPAAEKIYLFNCTNEDALNTILLNVAGEFAATVYNYDLSPLAKSKLEATNESLAVDLSVPQGGYVVLEKIGD